MNQSRRGFIAVMLAIPALFRLVRSPWPMPQKLKTLGARTPGPWVMNVTQVKDFEISRVWLEFFDQETKRLQALNRVVRYRSV